MHNRDFNNFISAHHLPDDYIKEAQQWFSPVAKSIAEDKLRIKKTLIVGINGSQGSGKSTLADYLALLLWKKYQMNVVILSIDDFYFTREQRQSLSETIHPLLATRGVPGTHDIELAIDVIHRLAEGKSGTLVPRFNKATDDRSPEGNWEPVTGRTDIIILEGWCLGAEPQPDKELLEPVNMLEKAEDPDGSWRRYVNLQLREAYPPLHKLVDTWIMLKAPSFDCVYQWRLEQEDKLRSSINNSPQAKQDSYYNVMDSKGIGRFIQYYQRITEHQLNTFPDKVDYLFELDRNRKIQSLRQTGSRPQKG